MLNSHSSSGSLFPSEAAFSPLPCIDPPSPSAQPLLLDPFVSIDAFRANDICGEEFEPGKRRRGRKELSQEERQVSRLRRSEQNRVYAKENRKRKKQHIVQLEAKVQKLTEELMVCKRRLAEYESAAASGSLKEFCERVRRGTQQLSGRLIEEVTKVIENFAPNNALNMLPAMQKVEDERTRALDMMAQAMIDLSIPLPCRHMIEIAEGIDAKSGKRKKDREDLLSVKTIMRNSIYDSIKQETERFFHSVPDVRKAWKESATLLRRCVNQYFISLENIKQKVIEMDLLMVERMAPRFDESYLRSQMVWTQVFICGAGNGAFVPRATTITAGANNGEEAKNINYC